MNDRKIITVDLWKAIGVLVFAIIGSAGAGIWTGFVALNADHYVLANTVKDVSKIEETLGSMSENISKLREDVGDIKGQLRMK